VCRVQTEYEGQAKKYMDVVDPTDAVITVGGDGTVSEVVSFHCQCTYEGHFINKSQNDIILLIFKI